MEENGKYRAPALDKGLDILELLAKSAGALSQAEIAKELGRTTNENYRMLDTLVRRNYVTRTPEGDRYMLSLKMLVLANTHPPRRRLLDISEPRMRQLSLQSEQSCHLAIWEDGDVVIAAAFSAPGNWRQSLRPGAVIGIFNTGSGRILTAFQSEEARARMLNEHQLVVGEDKTDITTFSKELDQLRDLGCVVEPSKTVRGTTNISFPVLDPSGNAVAALTCPFIERIDGHPAPPVEEVTKMFGAAAEEIGRQLNGD
ncbi:IclR family transcriptional regulator [Aliiroseovarius subalbicans]|uniref:IclR family transcriptional regulator n=1 Tax=Aliiroseovarius subalbicans TaxID=2925840 RepID=UPI001F567D45|nr:IclR family transcriptional regulator [Aliiroseovarius subalbicans]MCI2400907.1 IclR family transcriptional regulator [Aliiroseovarius subalbicans]